MYKTKRNICFIYSGQGSQYFNMGYQLYQKEAVFKEWIDKGDALFKKHSQNSLLDILYTSHPPTRAFDQLEYSHPAIMIIEIALSKFLISQGIIPDICWGNSIGEIAALEQAGVLELESAIYLAWKQAIAVKKNCELGAMLAIVDEPHNYLGTHAFKSVTFSSQNFDKHFTVSGAKKNILNLYHYLKEHAISCHMLPISYAFHSPMIDPAKQGFLEACQSIHFSKTTKTYLSSYTSTFLNDINKEHLWNSVRKPIHFQKTYSKIKEEPLLLIDIGPSGTMATFIKYNQPPDHHLFFETLHPMKKSLAWLDTLKQAIYLV